MIDPVMRLRAAFGRRRHRRLDRVAADLGSQIAGAHDDASAQIASLSRDVGFKAPALWNELHRPLEAPLPPAAELLSRAGAPAVEVVREKMALMADAQRLALEALGVDGVLARIEADDRPIPAPPDRERYFGDDHLAYWVSGLGDALWLEALAERHGVALASGRFLDFGCASGRVLRHVGREGAATAPLGVDIQPQAVRWARAHLAGPTIALTTVVPALPLADRSVDLLYAGSVFTHIDDFEEATLLELRRVLADDGVAVVTIHPDRIWPDMAKVGDHVVRGVVLGTPHRLDPPGVEPVTAEDLERPMPGERAVFTAVDWPVNNTNVVHSHDYIRRRWGALFAIEEIVERAHGDHQDAVVLRRLPEQRAGG